MLKPVPSLLFYKIKIPIHVLSAEYTIVCGHMLLYFTMFDLSCSKTDWHSNSQVHLSSQDTVIYNINNLLDYLSI